jgi:hypothetical protein
VKLVDLEQDFDQDFDQDLDQDLDQGLDREGEEVDLLSPGLPSSLGIPSLSSSPNPPSPPPSPSGVVEFDMEDLVGLEDEDFDQDLGWSPSDGPEARSRPEVGEGGEDIDFLSPGLPSLHAP